MKPVYAAAKISVFFFIATFFQSFSGPSGGDYYKVLLNNKLITEQYLTQPVAMKTLSLTPMNNSDHLVVFYSHCGSAGTNRKVSLRDQAGTVLKQWKFDDAKTIGLQLPVKDILSAAATKDHVHLYYSSKELTAGKELLVINVAGKATAKL